MIPSLKKRFWTETGVRPIDAGHGVTLDGRPIRTPAKAALVVPTRPLAEAIAAEWQTVEAEVDPALMPLTRRANAAIDKVSPQRTAVVQMLAEYGATDLLCYRAAHPAELATAQAAAWDGLLDWAAAQYDARLHVTTGVVPVAQDAPALARLFAALDGFTPFALTGVHDLVTLSGSLVIGLAATAPDADIEALWQAAQVDESWQTQLWGEDDEAREATGRKHQAFLDAFRFFLLAS